MPAANLVSRIPASQKRHARDAFLLGGDLLSSGCRYAGRRTASQFTSFRGGASGDTHSGNCSIYVAAIQPYSIERQATSPDQYGRKQRSRCGQVYPTHYSDFFL
jgi:hypothetical protein